MKNKNASEPIKTFNFKRFTAVLLSLLLIWQVTVGPMGGLGVFSTPAIQAVDATVEGEPLPVDTPEPTPTVTPEPTPVVTPEPTPVVTPEPTPVVTPEPTPEPKPPVITIQYSELESNPWHDTYAEIQFTVTDDKPIEIGNIQGEFQDLAGTKTSGSHVTVSAVGENAYLAKITVPLSIAYYGKLALTVKDSDNLEVSAVSQKLSIDGFTPVVKFEGTEAWLDKSVAEFNFTLEGRGAPLSEMPTVNLEGAIVSVTGGSDETTADENTWKKSYLAKVEMRDTVKEIFAKPIVRTKQSYIKFLSFLVIPKELAANETIKMDQKAPSASIVEAPSDWQASTARLTLTATDGPNAPAIKPENIKVLLAGKTETESNAAMSYFVSQDSSTPNQFFIDVTAKAGQNLNSKLSILVGDQFWNGTWEDTVHSAIVQSNKIKIDAKKPTIEWKIGTYNVWQKDSAVYEFIVWDDASKVKEEGISVALPDTLSYQIEKNPVGEVDESNPDRTGYRYQLTLTAKEDTLTKEAIKVSAKDNANHTAESASPGEVWLDNQKPQLKASKVFKTSAPDSKVYKLGDELSFELKLSDEKGSGIKQDTLKMKVNGGSEIDVAAKDVDALGNGIYSVKLIAGTDFPVSENQKLLLNVIDFSDNQGNQQQVKEISSELTYYRALEESETITNYKVWSENAEGSLIKNGEKVFLSFSSSHPVSAKSQLFLAGEKALNYTIVNELRDGLYYSEANYTIGQEASADNHLLRIETQFSDEANNRAYAAASHESIRYYASIESSMVDGSLSLVSSNANPRLAKNDDTITLSFKMTHPVSVSSLTIAGQSVSAKTRDGLNFTAQLVLNAGLVADNSDLPFSLSLSDRAGNPQASWNQNETAAVRYQAPLAVSNVQFSSNNGVNSALAKNGDTLNLSFSTTHVVEVARAEIAGRNVSFNSADGLQWMASFTVPNALVADEAQVPFSVSLRDAAGNEGISFNQSQASGTVHYLEPIVLSQIAITTNNSNDGTQFAKNGDTVTVSFNANHAVTLDEALLAGVKVAQAGSRTSWTFSTSITSGMLEDLSQVGFTFTVNDRAGNASVSKQSGDAEVSHRIRYFAPLQVTATLKSDFGEGRFAKNGTTLHVLGTANHLAKLSSGRIGGSDLAAVGEFNEKPLASLQIPFNEVSMTEGVLSLNLSYSDPAGNRFSLSQSSDGSQVIYDRTPVRLALSPMITGFTNKSIEYSLVFSDRYLDANSLSFTINGVEQITVADRASALGQSSWTKHLSLNEEGVFVLRSTAMDKAGNPLAEATEIALTIDKTGPKISSDRISDAQAMTVKSGFVLSDYIKVEESHIKDVLVTVTDANGVYDWNLDDPLTDEGKKTISITVVDQAGNKSPTFSFDLFVDATAPEALITDTKTGKTLKTGEVLSFTETMELVFELKDLRIGNSPVDQFTKLVLIAPDGTAHDLLATYDPNSGEAIHFKPEAYGEYELQYEAMDFVGNGSGSQSLRFSFLEKASNPASLSAEIGVLPGATGPAVTASDSLVTGTPVNLAIPAGIAAGILLLSALLWFILAKKRKKDER